MKRVMSDELKVMSQKTGDECKAITDEFEMKMQEGSNKTETRAERSGA
jgi:hypothetical protein